MSMRFMVEVEVNGRVFRRELNTDEGSCMVKRPTRVAEVLRTLSGDIFEEILTLDTPRESVGQLVAKERHQLGDDV